VVGPIPCATIVNDIVRSKVGTSHENNNLVLAQILAQCPLACARCIFNEKGMKIVNDTKMVLVMHHSCINIGVSQITLMCGIMNAFSTLATINCATTLLSMKPYLFIYA
jgi:hypothetical protein